MGSAGQGKPRGGNGRFVASPETAERDADAARLRVRGKTFRQIADELGYASEGKAYEAVQRSLLAIRSEPSDEVKQLELDRLDFMWTAVLQVLETHHYTVSNGRLIYVGEEPLADDGPVLAAVDRLLKIQERRAKYLGLDAPVRTEVRTVDNLDDEIRRLMDAMADGRQAGTATPAASQDATHTG